MHSERYLFLRRDEIDVMGGSALLGCARYRSAPRSRKSGVLLCSRFLVREGCALTFDIAITLTRSRSFILSVLGYPT